MLRAHPRGRSRDVSSRISSFTADATASTSADPRDSPCPRPTSFSAAPETVCTRARPTYNTVHSYSIYSNVELLKQFEVLVDAAKYDASCASSGAPKRGSRGINGLGATTGAGIRHSFTPDGRCVSLLKIPLANFCLYDCQYCVNRLRPASSEAG